MTDFTKLSDQELTEALNFHRRQRNMSRGINEAAHARQTQMVRILEAEEARRLEEAIDYSKEKPNHYVVYKRKNGEYGVSQQTRNGTPWDHSLHHGYHDTVDSAKAWAVKHAGKYPHKIEVQEEAELGEAVTVDKKNYHWGKMITVHHGSSHSFPLHPEHQEKIKNLKDGESTSFTDETRAKVTAKREGDKVHLSTSGAGRAKTTVAHSHFTEEVGLEEAEGSVKKNRELLATGRISKDEFDRRMGYGKYKTKGPAGVGPLGKSLYKNLVKTNEEVELSEAETNYVIKHKKTKQVLNTHSDYATAKDEHEGLGADKHEYGIYKQTKKDAALRNRNTYREEVEQIDEISTELKKRYVEKGAEDVVDRFTGRGKYERPRDPSKYTKTGRPKKSALNSPEAVKYRAKLDNRREIVNKVSQEVHGKKRFGEEFEINEASDLRITKIYNKWPKPATYAVHSVDHSYHKEFDSMEAAKAHHKEKTEK